ncbi:RNA-dependent ATPase rok1 [Exophiala xenobiotica]|nr:RNA-dependent ATPase rok1 [Exophiala xenobiotica]KAK5302312.1 RNA-dependent ATPase rok1 [Exophiala xenobiotica]KAK5315037.1 RNA-dependent ATPase rok1 [Exophiala xenobiotica]KAK5487311.1 RNA-dependent ATPase rok1 [Exophiala xenobiotica]
MDALRLLSRSTGSKARSAKSSPQNLQSASGHSTNDGILDPTAPRKRKRDVDTADDAGSVAIPSAKLSEEDVRQIQKKQKIKLVDLNRFRAAGENSESRKAQKEQSRIFPQPLISFDQLGQFNVNKALTRNVSNQAYFQPTEVQTATIPLLLRGSSEEASEPDLLTIAPTGSGKTLAFLIPLIEKVSRSHKASDDHPEKHISAIILAPTKELVSQIVTEGRKLCPKTGVRITAMRKGMTLFEGHAPTNVDGSEDDESEKDDEGQNSTATAPVTKTDILVSTPLSIVHALCPSWKEDESIPPHPLPNIETLILDEADVLLDPLFRAQTLALWSACTSSSLRISMWSATIGSNVEELAVETISRRHKSLKIRRSQRPPLLRTIIGLKDISLPNISHRLTFTATESGKLLGMRQLLHPSRSHTSGKEDTTVPLRAPFLVFTQTIERAQSLYNELRYDIPAPAGGSSRIAVLHSSLPTHTRSSIMQNFRLGKIWILITTDLLSRGVDFRGVNVVVNYDIPNTVAGYVHRAGRTGRAGREGGVCVSFYTKEDIQYVKGIANVIAASEKAQAPSGRTAGVVVKGNNSTTASDPAKTNGGIQPWLLHALPSVSKSARKNLKLHGVESRRAVHADDDEKTKRMKRKARIGTQSGFERREMNRKRGAIEHSLQGKGKELVDEDGKGNEDWEGFG